MLYPYISSKARKDVPLNWPDLALGPRGARLYWGEGVWGFLHAVLRSVLLCYHAVLQASAEVVVLCPVGH